MDAQSLEALQQQLKGGAASGERDVPSPLEAGPQVPADGRALDGEARRQQDGRRDVGRLPAVPEVSTIENDYRGRMKSAMPRRLAVDVERPAEGEQPLTQFGYDMFRNRAVTGAPSAVPSGAVADDYRLGIGDEIVVTMRGQRSTTVRTRIDREGRLVLPDLKPITAAGRYFGEVRDELSSQVAQAFVQTEAFVSVGAVRSVGVYVLGEVAQPGLQRVSGLSTVVDALVAAGGPRRTGTLRHVVVTHENSSVVVDLYNLLIDGRLKQDITLADGDRVFVGPLGPTVAIAGDVARPGIYELPPKAAGIRAADALALAGGTLRPSGYLYLRIGADKSGREQAAPLGGLDGVPLRGGDIMLVERARNPEIGGFTLDGHVAVSGVRSLQAEPTVSSLLTDLSLFKDSPYLLFAALQTTDEQTRARHFVPVDLSRIVDGKGDVFLKANDRLIILGADDIRYLSSADVQTVIGGASEIWRRNRPTDSVGDRLLRQASDAANDDFAPAPGEKLAEPPKDGMAKDETNAAANAADKTTATGTGTATAPRRLPKACAALRDLAAVTGTTRSDRFANAFQTTGPDPVRPRLINRMPCRDIYERYPELLAFVLEYGVALQGDVRLPGIYPMLPDTPLSKGVAEAGGLARGVDLSKIEVTHFDDTATEGAVERRTLDARTVPLQQVAVRPGDIVRFNPTFTGRDNGPVVIGGEVKRPGIYPIYRGEKLSEVMRRAGGFAAEAYPLGAVFTRVRVRQQELESHEVAARQYEQSLAQFATSGKVPQEAAGQMAVLQGMIASIRSAPASGRVVAELDPTVLAVRPELDTVLEPGDEIFVPKRPNHVSVSGEVLMPTALQFDPELDPKDYIREAGGLTQAADLDRAFVILPDGKAQPLTVSSWNYTSVHIPPGSTIVVPRDPAPFQWWTFSKDIADLASKVAISAASLAVINR